MEFDWETVEAGAEAYTLSYFHVTMSFQIYCLQKAIWRSFCASCRIPITFFVLPIPASTRKIAIVLELFFFCMLFPYTIF